jgi:hypothetical protein
MILSLSAYAVVKVKYMDWWMYSRVGNKDFLGTLQSMLY